MPFLAYAIAVGPTEIVVAGFVHFGPSPSERRSTGVVARLRGTAWTVAGFHGQRPTDPLPVKDRESRGAMMTSKKTAYIGKAKPADWDDAQTGPRGTYMNVG